MIYGSVCSGIEAATMAWHPLGWTPAFFSEIEKFPSAMLAHHYGSNMPEEPVTGNGVPNYGDMTEFERWPDHAIDILVGGTPCQDYSIAGLRKGMAGGRGSLTLTFIQIAARYRPKWFVWENVPGVLSSNNGRDFARFLGDISGTKIEVPADGWKNSGIVEGIADAYGLAYRVLDTQFVRVDGFGRAIPQRRRRVFVIGYLGDWRCAAAVLLEPESLRGDTPPRRKAGEGFAAGTIRSTDGGCDVFHARAGHLIPFTKQAIGEYDEQDVSSTVSARDYKDATRSVAFSSKDYGGDAETDLSPTLRAGGHDGSHANAGIPPAIAFAQNQRGELRTSDVIPSLGAGGGKPGEGYPAVAYDLRGREGGAQFEGPHDVANIRAASGGSSRSYVQDAWSVRRLTPVECERLQGFPDGFTQIPWRNKPAEQCPDGPRYKALGNSMSVNVMRWIGRRIEMVEALL